MRHGRPPPLSRACHHGRRRVLRGAPARASPERIETVLSRNTRRASRRGSGVLTFFGVLLLVAGLALGGAVLIAPDRVETAYGDVKTSVQGAVQEASGEAPTVRLGEEGDEATLDICDGSFFEMATYRDSNAILPVFAAHNNCGGDVILSWEVGTQVQIEGRPGLYEVVEIRNTGKTWVTTSDLVGLQGELALQTCYYGVEEMRFVGLSPVAGS